jgi:hypothetical protein
MRTKLSCLPVTGDEEALTLPFSTLLWQHLVMNNGFVQNKASATSDKAAFMGGAGTNNDHTRKCCQLF